MATDPSPALLRGPAARRLRRRVLLLALAAAAVGGALYLNRISERWVPEAKAQVAAAREAQRRQHLQDLERRARENPGDRPAQQELARALIDQGSFVAALLPAERAVAAAPDSWDAHLLLGEIGATLDYRAMALEHYRRAIALAPGQLEPYQRLGDLLLAGGDRAAAERVFKQAHDRDPQAAGPRLSLARLYQEGDRDADALALLDPLLAGDEAPLGALYLAGEACRTLGQTARGADLLRRAIAREPQFADAQHALGALLCNQGDYPEGLALLQRATQLAPQNATFFYALGNALRSDRSRPARLEEACRAYEASLELDPHQPWAHYYYGVALEQQGELLAAERQYRRTLELHPKFASAYYRLGAVCRALGRAAEARRYTAIFERESQRAIADVHGQRRKGSVLDTAEAHYQRGLQFLSAGSRRKAEADFRVALQRDPHHGGARRELQALGVNP